MIRLQFIKNDSLCTSQRTKCASVKNINHLMLSREIMAVYYKNHIEQTNKYARKLRFLLLLNLARPITNTEL